MLLDFYQLNEQPFGVTPNPRFLYLGPSHREALASLCYGVKMGRGLATLVAPPGMGKTTLLFRLLEHLRHTARTAFLFQTQCDSNGLLHYLLSDLGISTRGQDFVGMHDQLNSLLVEEARAGRRFVVIIDEAQNLDEKVLETARLLTDFETPNEKLLQIILAGQPQLAEKLKRPELVQLRQRISSMSRLQPLDLSEVNDYINHRLEVAGCTAAPLFTASAVSKIASISEGIPRNINNLCFNVLSLGYALGAKKIDVELISEVAADLDLAPSLTADPLPPEQVPVARKQVVVAVDSGRPIEPIGEELDPVTTALEERNPHGHLSETCTETGSAQASALAESSFLENYDSSELGLESLELALARNAEIVAEVIDSGGYDEDASDALQFAVYDAQEEQSSTAFSPVADTASFIDTECKEADSVSADSLQIADPLESSCDAILPLTLSYSAKRTATNRRLAVVAASFALFFAGFYFRRDIAATTANLRQIVASSSSRALLHPSPAAHSAVAEQAQDPPASTTPSQHMSPQEHE